MLRFAVVLLALTMLLSGCTSGETEYVPRTVAAVPGESGWNAAPLHAELAPPITTYTSKISATDTTLVPPDVTWSNSNTCGRFEKSGISWPARGAAYQVNATAIWHHGDDTDCSHDGPLHNGTVMMTATLSRSSFSLHPTVETITCAYVHGSESGNGEACTMTRTEYFSQEKTPATGLLALLAVLGVGAVLIGSRRRAR